MKINADDMARATGGSWVHPFADGLVERICTDSRTLQPGDAFLALEGERFDGHDYLAGAAGAGAAALIVRRDFPADRLPEGAAVLRVDSTLRALGDLAIFWRDQCEAPRVAVVGSSGKTTTKDMLASILQDRGPTLATRGNFNNLIGLPLTLFGLDESHRWAVLELGMNEPGELLRLTEIAAPNLLVLTNVGTAHVGQFGSIERLIDAKADAVRALRPGVPVLYNSLCPNTSRIVAEWGRGRPAGTFAVGESAQVCARDVRPGKAGGYRFTLEINGRGREAEIGLFGRYNVANAVAAAAAAHTLGVEASAIVESLRGFKPSSMRSEVREIAGVTCVIDCYNANPESMRAALHSLRDWAGQRATRLFLVLGDMLELGDHAAQAHAALGREAARVGPEAVLLVGDLSREALAGWTGDPERVRRLDSKDEAARALVEWVRPGDTVLFKGSRGIGLETVVRDFERLMSRQDGEERASAV